MSKWIADLVNWYECLQKNFGFNSANLAANVRNNVHKWEKRLEYLKTDNRELYDYLIDAIKMRHSIPFSKTPDKYFRKSDPPSLAKDKQGASVGGYQRRHRI